MALKHSGRAQQQLVELRDKRMMHVVQWQVRWSCPVHQVWRDKRSQMVLQLYGHRYSRQGHSEVAMISITVLTVSLRDTVEIFPENELSSSAHHGRENTLS